MTSTTHKELYLDDISASDDW